MSVTPQPPKGTRDLLAREVRKRYWVLDVIQDLFEAYGFEPLETPAFENIETLMAKGGGENEKLMFKILKRGEGEKTGEADLALRFDHTVPLARVVASHFNEIAFPYKVYQLGPVWRAERPQKGRFREFTQCDIDIIGAEAPYAESEVLAVFHDILRDLQLADARIVVNHRGLLNGLLLEARVPRDAWTGAIIALDKWDKIGEAAVREQYHLQGIPAEATSRLFELIEAFNAAFAAAVAQEEEFQLNFQLSSAEGQAALEELGLLWHLLAAQRLELDTFIADARLARGLDYYTGPVFEIQLMGPEKLGSLGGGGRYDGLVGTFMKQDLPAVGFSIGFDRLVDVLEQLDLYPENVTWGTEVLVTTFSEETVMDNLSLAQEIRDSGALVETYPNPGNLGRQFKYADKKGIRFVIVQGPDEIAGDSVKVKDLNEGQEASIKYEELLDWIADKLNPPPPQNGGRIRRRKPGPNSRGSRMEE